LKVDTKCLVNPLTSNVSFNFLDYLKNIDMEIKAKKLSDNKKYIRSLAII